MVGGEMGRRPSSASRGGCAHCRPFPPRHWEMRRWPGVSLVRSVGRRREWVGAVSGDIFAAVFLVFFLRCGVRNRSFSRASEPFSVHDLWPGGQS